MRYQINVYYGGEMDDETWYASSLNDARRISTRGEHQEIIDTKTNKIVEL